jgi:XTP/dITP diphosphohydrolase
LRRSEGGWERDDKSPAGGNNGGMKQKLLIATGNNGKVKEIRHEIEVAAAGAHDAWLGSIEVVGLKDLPPMPECTEDEPTFEGNARKKASHFAGLTGLMTLADDSGLCVEALGGEPGVYSARYAGMKGPGADAANNAKLLAAMKDVPDDRRQAKFVCAMALVAHDAGGARDLALMVDEVHGVLLREARGTNGFGYDPLFFFPEFGKTTAELDMVTKGRISHRGKALRKMIAWMRAHHGEIK